MHQVNIHCGGSPLCVFSLPCQSLDVFLFVLRAFANGLDHALLCCQ